MSMVMLNAERQEVLLELANQLGRRLGQTRVPRLGRGGEETTGISKSAVSVVSSFLAAERDLEKLDEFVQQLPQLDQRSAQNERNPKAEHRALRDELQKFLAEQRELAAEEALFVLRWAGRLVDFYAPRDAKDHRHPNGGERGGGKTDEVTKKERGQEEQQGKSAFSGTMAAALQKALERKE